MSKPDLERLSAEEKRALLRRLLAAEAAAVPMVRAEPPLPIPAAGAGPHPASFAQERLWFVEELAPGSPLFGMLVGVRLRGLLDPPALLAALADVVARHETLRTTYRFEEGALRQHVAEAARPEVARLDLAGLPAHERERALVAYGTAQACRGFDLARGAILRAHLVDLGPAEHALLLHVHHIAIDGWSVSVLLGDLVLAYEARQRGQGPAWPPLPLRYVDFAAWQRGWFQGEVEARHLAFWRAHLRGAPTTLGLPRDRLDGADRGASTDASDEVRFTIDVGLARALRTLGRQEGATLATILLAAFQALLGLQTGRDDLIVGVVSANRTRPELAGMVGCFVNALPLRADLAGDPSARTLVGRVRDATRAALAHQDAPLERIVRDVLPARVAVETPLFQALFTMNNTPRATGGAAGLTAEPIVLARRTTEFELGLELREARAGTGREPPDDEVVGVLDYRTSRLEATTAQRLAARYLRILRAAAATPDLPLSRIALDEPTERELVRDAWSGRGEPTPAPASVVARIAAAAARTPDAVALVAGAERVTYAQLLASADRLAAVLTERGVGIEDRVGLLAARSGARVTGLLGILLSGATVVPLDPTWPAERLRLVLADSRARLVVETDGLHVEVEGVDTLALDATATRAVPPPGSRVPIPPEAGAYLVYTSGSTGRPKGTLVEHRSLDAHARAVSACYGLAATDRVMQFANPVFDVSFEETIPTLALGATLIVGRRDELGTIPGLLELAGREGVTVLNLPSSLWSILVDVLGRAGPGALPASVRLVVIGSEVASPAACRAWFGLRPSARLVNAYGPTEATITATVWSPGDDDPARAGERAVPIGRPVPGCTAYVLDARGEPAPIGIPGELVLGGPGVSRGYDGQPGPTASAFVPDPYGPPGARLYLTGDRARWLADGQLELLGRRDRQIKLRGHRIELEEIEAVAQGLPGVGRVAVILDETPAGPELVAYLEPADGARPSVDSLRAGAAEVLPSLLRPARWHVLAALPVTAGGKIDRSALPRLAEAHPAATRPPRTETERQLLAVWRALLGRDSLGVSDDFFASGGHSLLLVRMLAEIEGAFGRRLPLADVLEGCTIEALARRLEEAPTTPSVLIPLDRRGDGAPLFLLPPAGVDLVCYAELVRRIGGARPSYGLSPRDVPQDSLADAARAYAGAVTSLQATGPYLLAGWSLGGVLTLEVARVLSDEGRGRSRLVLIDPPLPTGLGGPDEDPALASFIRDVGWAVAPELVEAAERTPGADALAALLALLRDRDERIPWSDAELARMRASHRAQARALARHRAAPFATEATLYVAAANRPPDVRALHDQGWRALVGPTLRVVDLAVGHREMLTGPAAAAIALDVVDRIAG